MSRTSGIHKPSLKLYFENEFSVIVVEYLHSFLIISGAWINTEEKSHQNNAAYVCILICSLVLNTRWRTCLNFRLSAKGGCFTQSQVLVMCESGRSSINQNWSSVGGDHSWSGATGSINSYKTVLRASWENSLTFLVISSLTLHKISFATGPCCGSQMSCQRYK